MNTQSWNSNKIQDSLPPVFGGIAFKGQALRAKFSLSDWVIALGLCLGFVWMFWPGTMRPDSYSQISEALSGQFTDHHPPMMAWYWGFLHKIYPGPGLMLSTHLVLAWASAFLFYRAYRAYALSRLYWLVLFFPGLFSYLTFVLKDVSFTWGYMLALSILTWQNAQ
ncbi:MAG: hypothetical protein ACKOAD_03695, partial [Gammaproteobacteria bacterium]